MNSQHIYTFTPTTHYYIPFPILREQKSLRNILSEGLKKSFEKFCELYLQRTQQKVSEVSKEPGAISREVQVIEIWSENEEILHNKNRQLLCANTSCPKITQNPSQISKFSLLDVSHQSLADLPSSTPLLEVKNFKLKDGKELKAQNKVERNQEDQIDLVKEPKRRAFGQIKKKIIKKKLSLLSRKVIDWAQVNKKFRNQRKQIRMLRI